MISNFKTPIRIIRSHWDGDVSNTSIVARLRYLIMESMRVNNIIHLKPIFIVGTDETGVVTRESIQHSTLMMPKQEFRDVALTRFHHGNYGSAVTFSIDGDIEMRFIGLHHISNPILVASPEALNSENLDPSQVILNLEFPDYICFNYYEFKRDDQDLIDNQHLVNIESLIDGWTLTYQYKISMLKTISKIENEFLSASGVTDLQEQINQKITQNGDTFETTMIVGTRDDNSVLMIANDNPILTIETTGRLFANTPNYETLVVNGTGGTLANKQYVDDKVDSVPEDAGSVTYNNATSGLSAVNVQTAIDEVKTIVDSVDGSNYVTKGGDAGALLQFGTTDTSDFQLMKNNTPLVYSQNGDLITTATANNVILGNNIIIQPSGQIYAQGSNVQFVGTSGNVEFFANNQGINFAPKQSVNFIPSVDVGSLVRIGVANKTAQQYADEVDAGSNEIVPNKQYILDRLATKSNEGHTHTKVEILDFAHDLDSHTNVDINNPQPDDVLRFDDVDYKWKNFTNTVDYSNVQNKPSTFTPSSHTHFKSDILDFSHTHVLGDLPANVATTNTSQSLTNKTISATDNAIDMSLYHLNNVNNNIVANPNEPTIKAPYNLNTWNGYTAFASGTFDNNNATWGPWRAFDGTLNGSSFWNNNGAGAWSNGNYNNLNNLVVDGSTIYGEHIGIQLPTAIVLKRFTMFIRNDSASFVNKVYPSKFHIIGSNNGGSTWTSIYHHNDYFPRYNDYNTTVDAGGLEVRFYDFAVNSSVAYNRLAMLAYKIGDNGNQSGNYSCSLAELSFVTGNRQYLSYEESSKQWIGQNIRVGDVVDLPLSLNSKSNTGHVHPISDVTGLQTNLDSRVLKAGDTMTGLLNMGSNKVTSSSVPSTAIDLTNRLYVDNMSYRQFAVVRYVNYSTPHFIGGINSGIPRTLDPPTSLAMFKGNWSQASNGRLRYDGTGTWNAKVTIEYNGNWTNNGREGALFVRKNTTDIPTSEARRIFVDAGIYGVLSTHAYTTLTTNDTIEGRLNMISGNATNLEIARVQIYVELLGLV